MRWDKNKLQSLSDNLDFALNESIYRNASPINIDRIDIASSSLSDAFSTHFVKQLLNGGNVDAEIQSSDEQAHKFHHLFTEQINEKEDMGSHSLGFGYPTFIHKEAYTLFPIAAPFFIWDVEMEPSPNRTNTWSLKRNGSFAVRANRFLIHYLKEKFDYDIQQQVDNLLSQESIDAGKLSAFCNKISVQLDIPGNTSGYAIIPAYEQDELKNLSEEPIIRFSGTISIFGQNHLHLSQFLKEKIEYAEDQPFLMDDPVSSNYGHPFSLIKPDPCQKNIAKKVMDQSMTIAEGAAGTGKTYTATHVASNALANGKTCLIVSANKSGLEQIHTTLNTNHVGGLSYLFMDAETDIDNFYYALKQLCLKSYKPNRDQGLGFKILLERVISKHDKLEAHHQLMNKQAFGSFDFTDTVGHYIGSNRYSGKDILSGKLSPREYKFTFREYDILKTDIIKGEKLYKRVKRLDHPLQVLHEELFLEKSLEKSKKYIDKQLVYYKGKTEKLLRRFTEGLESYRDSLREHYEDHARELNAKAQDIKNKIGEYAQVFGEDFKRSSTVKLQMYGVFSDTYFNIKEAKKEINREFAELEELYGEKKYFTYKFPKKKEVDTIQTINHYLVDFEEKLVDWTHNINLGVRQESDTLNSKSVQIHLDYKNRIGDLEYQHDILLEELNQTKLFKEWFGYDGYTLSKRSASLESLWNLLDRTERNMGDYDDFYPWQKHWSEILPVTKETITALVRSHASNWLKAFNSWYFYNCLSDRAFLSSSVDDRFRDNYLDDLTHLRNQLPIHIQSMWGERKSVRLDQLKKKDKKMHQLLTHKKSELPNSTTLKELFITYSNELPDCFPIMMMTPDIAEELLAHSRMSFDLVIFDDAHQIPTAQAIPVTEKADRVLAIGDRHQSLFNGTQELLLHTLVESGADIVPLYYKHVNNERACHEFINHTSYQKGIKSINYFTNPYTEQGIFVHLSERSRYDEETQSNKLEAEHLVRILSEMSPKNDGNMPKTAIVASTVSQRDHINSYLLYIKQKRNPFVDKIDKLEKAGLRVLHVSELTNYYETIVWSVTYGSTNLRGHITSHLDDMERSFGQTALNIILSHTLNQLLVCTSVPIEHVNEKFAKDPNACGPVIKFLKYADATNRMDEEERGQLLKDIEWPGVQKSEKDMNKFMGQVKKELEPYFEQDRIKLLSPLSELGTAAITILPLDYKQPIPLIIGDALDRNIKTIASEFERSVLKNLKTAGYQVFKTNSLEWWKNPKREARMLASRLIKADNTPVLPKKIS